MAERGRLVDFIPAFAGLAGVLVGGLITLYSNRSIQNHEFDQQARADLRAARAAATLEVYRFASVRSALQALVDHPDGPIVRPPPDQLDSHSLALLLTHLDWQQIEAYESGNACLTAYSSAHITSSDGSAFAPFLAHTQRCVDDTIAALKHLAQSTSPQAG